ncbi:hypothetical protein RND81_03G093800 [Saponaria officinalis]|uniref:VanZ-like domain-containing protein n=1 Tax=Saponaria officinalis TaxID=3572 RepID=A0AAW1M6H9_SAPOF
MTNTTPITLTYVNAGLKWWIATEKFYHLIFCFTLTLFFFLLVVHTRHRFLRRHSTVIAASLSLLAGAAKEFADHLGFFQSSGALFRDGVADFAGVVIACLLLYLFKFFRQKPKSGDIDADVELV